MILNPEHVTEAEAESHYHCEAARTIAIDSNRHIGLLHVTKEGYYKLPGGGIENGKDKITALKRDVWKKWDVMSKLFAPLSKAHAGEMKRTGLDSLTSKRKQNSKSGWEKIRRGLTRYKTRIYIHLDLTSHIATRLIARNF